ncbi:MAG: hypothetical protein AB8B83_08760 [Bdellovibrionales bacterium]
MRQQYHSRMVGHQLYIWDVQKLVEAAHGLAVAHIALNDIKELDEDYWYDAKSLPATPRSVAVHAMLMSQCDLDYPIILCEDGKIMDGMHRCCQALIEQRDSIKAVQFKNTPEPDYIDVNVKDLPHDAPVTL